MRILIAAGALIGVGGIVALVLRPWSNRPASSPSSPKSDETNAKDGSQKGSDITAVDINGEVEAAAAHGPAIALIDSPVGRGDYRPVGTGFLVAPDLVMTSSRAIRAHTIGNLRINFPSAAGNDREVNGKAVLLYEHPQRDLAILRIPRASTKPLRFGTMAPNAGSSVMSIGYPFTGSIGEMDRRAPARAQQLTVAQIDVADMSHQFNYYRVDGIRTAISGGPLMNAGGEVIGMLLYEPPAEGTWQRPDLGQVIPLADLRAAVDKAQGRTADEIRQAMSKHDEFRLFAHIREAWQLHRRSLHEAMRQTRESEKKSMAIQDHMREFRRSQSDAQEENLETVVDPLLAHELHYEALVDEFSKREADAVRGVKHEKLGEFRTNYLKLRLLYLTPPKITTAEFEQRIREADSRLQAVWDELMKEFGGEL